MNPEEKELLTRTLKLSEENNKILHRMQKTARWALIWGFIKVVIIVTPLLVGYFYFQPFLEQMVKNVDSVKELLNVAY